MKSFVRRYAVLTILCCIAGRAQTTELSRQDARLNDLYQRRVAQSGSDSAALANLRIAERDWIHQRDLRCAKDSTCLTQETKNRADYFAGQLRLSEPTAARVPREVLGRWIVSKVIRIDGISCFSEKQIRAVLRTEVRYTADSIRWKNKTARVIGAKRTEIPASQFAQDNAGGSGGGAVNFKLLGISGPSVLEFTIEHSDVDTGWGTVGLPGDRVLLKSPDTLVFSACAVWFELKRM